VLVRRHSEAAVTEWHRLRSHILMDAGELGSRHMSVTWIEVPSGASENLHAHEEAEQVYVVVRGSGTMSAAGDTQRLEAGDLAMIPPATDHSIANEGDRELALVSVQSPAVSVEELYERQLAGKVSGEYSGYDDQYE
jgi:mannose-6-phosphate isomerase-like protein (cupin superfamily)